MKKSIALISPSRISINSDLDFRRKLKASHQFIKKKLEEFFEENSTIDPSKKRFKKMENEKVQMRYLNHSMVDLHSKFRSENHFSLSYATFTRYRPKYCIAPKVTERNTCTCFSHENFSLLINSLKQFKLIKENSIQKVISQVLCKERNNDCYTRTCEKCSKKSIEFNPNILLDNNTISFYKWISRKEDRVNEKTQKSFTVQITKKEKMFSNAESVTNTFKAELNTFLLHEMRVLHQQNYLNRLKKSLKYNELIILMDFSENYQCKYSAKCKLYTSVQAGSRSQYIPV